jgi:DNA-directed RNA polymerase subunit F
LVNDLLKIEQVSESLACKIVDLMPKHRDEVDAIFLKERMTLEEESVTQILEKAKKYL